MPTHPLNTFLTRKALVTVALCGLALATSLRSQAEAPPQVSVNTKTYNGYARAKLPDGSLKPEYYTIAEGGRWNFSGAESVEAISFSRLAQLMAGTLGTLQYLPARDTDGADLMIVLYWGATKGAQDGEYSHELSMVSDTLPSNAGNPNRQSAAVGAANRAAAGDLNSVLMLNQLETEERDENNAKNARILGYYDDFERGMSELGNGTWRGRDAITEIEANRYFIVLKAYDSHLALKDKKLKLLWEARFSIYERGYDFGEQVPAMVRVASRYFGRDSKGLIRDEPAEGNVKIGNATVIPSGPATDDKH